MMEAPSIDYDYGKLIQPLMHINNVTKNTQVPQAIT